jgi:3-hydroxymyristoyl/3-hydroxydecanoyl-(acyl carrier protein) dehydratase
MRWRFVDRVGRIEPWQRARAEKCVSLEEYFLLERLGRRGSLPESLVLASFVELARWLVVASSEFESSALLTEVQDFAFRGALEMGAVLELEVSVVRRDGATLSVLARGVSRQISVSEGSMSLALCPLRELSTAATARRLWQELHASAR